jgi:hypothetical protein
VPGGSDGGLCREVSVSLDWLLGGDLKGLQRMMRERKARSQTPRRTPAQLAALLEKIPGCQRRKIEDVIGVMLEVREAPAPTS